MQKTTVLMIVHNQKESLCKSIAAIKKYTLMDNLHIVVVDNASEDGTKEWLAEQPDIAYAVEEQYGKSWGALVNEAIEVFGIDGDILLMQAGCVATMKCIELLKQALYMRENIAAVGPILGTLNDVNSDSDVPDMTKVLGLTEEMIMIRGDIFVECLGGRFEEGYHMYKYAVLDYFIHVIKSGKDLYCINNAVAIYINEQEDLSQLKEIDRIKLCERWGMKYFNTISNKVIVEMLNEKAENTFSVLEIGCDCGATLLEIKNRFPSAKVYGYEINTNAADIAKCVAEVEVGNVEEEKFPYKQQYFDYILFGDVLEHLHNPERVIEYCHSFLKESGCIIACIPNLMHISVVNKLLEGNFTYTDTGLLDRTHIHLFTFNEIITMFKKTGYHIENVISRTFQISKEEEQKLDKIMSIVTSSERWMFETFQYVLRARK